MKTLLWTTNNQFTNSRLKEYLDYLEKDRHKDENVNYEISIKKIRPIRSNDQNRYYWAIIMAFCVPSGYDKDELHEFFKKKFRGKYVLDELIGQSTSTLDSKEFSNYVKQCKVFGESFFGIKIPNLGDKQYKVWEQVTRNKYNQMFDEV